MLKKYCKYGAKKTVVDGHEFASKMEANRYIELRILLKMNKISNLILQPKFLLQEGFIHNKKRYREINYVADFQYEENGKIVVEEVKGYETDVWKIKKTMFKYKYRDIDFRVIY